MSKSPTPKLDSLNYVDITIAALTNKDRHIEVDLIRAKSEEAGITIQ